MPTTSRAGVNRETDPRKTYRWQQLCKTYLQPGAICYLCGQPITFGLRPWHPSGPSLDHVIPIEAGGDYFDPSNLAPAHYGCNARKGAKTQRQSSSW